MKPFPIPSSRKSEFSLPGRPKKSLGQYFLINPRVLDKIVAAAEITKDDLVLEVGPGIGNLTAKLAEKAKKVIAIEKDRRLIAKLEKVFEKNKNVEIIEGDILKFNIDDLKIARDYKIVGNIPYYITGKLFKIIFEKWSRLSSNSISKKVEDPRFGKTESRPKPKLIVLTIQKEVAQRITAKPPKMNLLAVSVQFFSKPEITSYISKENFRPRPKVDSAIIKLTPKEKLPTDDVEKFFKIVRAGFSQKRKQLIKNLTQNFGILKKDLLKLFEKIGIEKNARAENLTLNQWLGLTGYIKES